MTFKIVVSDPKTRKSFQKEVSKKESALVGRKIGDKVSGDFLGLSGYEFEVTGGSDKQGFPMRRDISGSARKRMLLIGPPGFHPTTKGERRRKSVRGNAISDEIVQVNLKAVKHGGKSLEDLFGKKEEKKEEHKEKPKEEKKEAPKAEGNKSEEKQKPENKKEEHKEAPKAEEKNAEEPKK